MSENDLMDTIRNIFYTNYNLDKWKENVNISIFFPEPDKEFVCCCNNKCMCIFDDMTYIYAYDRSSYNYCQCPNNFYRMIFIQKCLYLGYGFCSEWECNCMSYNEHIEKINDRYKTKCDKFNKTPDTFDEIEDSILLADIPKNLIEYKSNFPNGRECFCMTPECWHDCTCDYNIPLFTDVKYKPIVIDDNDDSIITQ